MLFRPRPKWLGKENFLKLEDGAEVTGLFKGEIYTFRNHWMGEGKPSAECSGAECPVCASSPDKKSGFRFRINFVTTKDGQWVAKIFEGGGELYDQLVTIDKKFDLAATVVDLSRSGKGKNTRYGVLPRKDVPITKEMAAKIEAVKLLPISHLEQEKSEAS